MRRGPWPRSSRNSTSIGVPEDAWDRIVTSGDVTRELIRGGPRKVFHLGPERDLTLYDGLDVETVEEFEADVVVCTGFFDDETETPEDYADRCCSGCGRATFPSFAPIQISWSNADTA